uniref:Uncharacterized protein n=1 Tax=Arundo donax TaxID=35708 RepID=A0A0A9CIM7_ARUDO
MPASICEHWPLSSRSSILKRIRLKQPRQ